MDESPDEVHGEQSQPTGDFQPTEEEMPSEITAEASCDLDDEALLEAKDIQKHGNEQSLSFEKEQGNFEGTPSQTVEVRKYPKRLHRLPPKLLNPTDPSTF